MKNRSYWIDNLRSFVIILVVAHHAELAYPTFARFDKAAYIFSSHPMVDAQRWIGMDWFIYFNDIFLMALMFFISGLSDTYQNSGKFYKQILEFPGIKFLFYLSDSLRIRHLESIPVAADRHVSHSEIFHSIYSLPFSKLVAGSAYSQKSKAEHLVLKQFLKVFKVSEILIIDCSCVPGPMYKKPCDRLSDRLRQQQIKTRSD